MVVHGVKGYFVKSTLCPQNLGFVLPSPLTLLSFVIPMHKSNLEHIYEMQRNSTVGPFHYSMRDAGG